MSKFKLLERYGSWIFQNWKSPGCLYPPLESRLFLELCIDSERLSVVYIYYDFPIFFIPEFTRNSKNQINRVLFFYRCTSVVKYRTRWKSTYFHILVKAVSACFLYFFSRIFRWKLLNTPTTRPPKVTYSKRRPSPESTGWNTPTSA